MREIRENYLSAFAQKSDFIAAMSTWVHKPNSETSIMTFAVEKYSLMPNLSFEKYILKDICAYIYETDFK